MAIKQYLEEHKEDLKPWLKNNEQGRVEIKILPYLQDMDRGFFVEAGALDGLFMSNTKILEDLGWNGLLVEPSGRAVEQCRKNRKVPVEYCALVSKDFNNEFIDGDFVFDGDSGLGALSSINRHAYQVHSMGKINGISTLVPAHTLDYLFKKHGIKKVDFLSLDVEGYELEVLKGIDFNEVDISFILLEVNFTNYSLEDAEKILRDYKNLGCISNFSKESNEGWDGSHQDYLFKKNG